MHLYIESQRGVSSSGSGHGIMYVSHLPPCRKPQNSLESLFQQGKVFFFFFSKEDLQVKGSTRPCEYWEQEKECNGHMQGWEEYTPS